MSGEVKTNYDKFIQQVSVKYPHLDIVNWKEAKRTFSKDGITFTFGRSTVKCDSAGRIYEYKKRGYKPNLFDPVTPTNTFKYKYNEHGDIIQEVYDYKSDGKIDKIIDYECKYDKNNKLVSREETLKSKIRNTLTDNAFIDVFGGLF